MTFNLLNGLILLVEKRKKYLEVRAGDISYQFNLLSWKIRNLFLELPYGWEMKVTDDNYLLYIE